jgi:hypothetical protein
MMRKIILWLLRDRKIATVNYTVIFVIKQVRIDKLQEKVYNFCIAYHVILISISVALPN